MMPGRDRFGFEIITRIEEGRRNSFARFNCRCGNHEDFRIFMHPLNPEAMAKKASAHGWDASGYQKGRARCPICKNTKEKGESPKENDVSEKVTKLPRAVTPDDKRRVREKLDKHFDDSTGRYLDGFSDQKVAEALNIPRVIVEGVREAAYGPLRGNPELDTLKADIEAAHKRLVEFTANTTKEIAGLIDRVKKLEG